MFRSCGKTSQAFIGVNAVTGEVVVAVGAGKRVRVIDGVVVLMVVERIMIVFELVLDFGLVCVLERCERGSHCTLPPSWWRFIAEIGTYAVIWHETHRTRERTGAHEPRAQTVTVPQVRKSRGPDNMILGQRGHAIGARPVLSLTESAGLFRGCDEGDYDVVSVKSSLR